MSDVAPAPRINRSTLQELIAGLSDGIIFVDPDGSMAFEPGYLALGGTIHRPNPDHAGWLLAEMIAAGQVTPAPRRSEAAKAVYAPDVYDRALRMTAPAG